MIRKFKCWLVGDDEDSALEIELLDVCNLPEPSEAAEDFAEHCAQDPDIGGEPKYEVLVREPNGVVTRWDVLIDWEPRGTATLAKEERDADAGAAPASGRSRAPRPTDMNGSSSSARRAHSRPDGLNPSEEHTE